LYVIIFLSFILEVDTVSGYAVWRTLTKVKINLSLLSEVTDRGSEVKIHTFFTVAIKWGGFNFAPFCFLLGEALSSGKAEWGIA
jgi:hypothetical protein